MHHLWNCQYKKYAVYAHIDCGLLSAFWHMLSGSWKSIKNFWKNLQSMWTSWMTTTRCFMTTEFLEFHCLNSCLQYCDCGDCNRQPREFLDCLDLPIIYIGMWFFFAARHDEMVTVVSQWQVYTSTENVSLTGMSTNATVKSESRVTSMWPSIHSLYRFARMSTTYLVSSYNSSLLDQNWNPIPEIWIIPVLLVYICT